MRTPTPAPRPLVSTPALFVLLALFFSVGAYANSPQDPVVPPVPLPEDPDEEEPDDEPASFQSIRDRLNAQILEQMTGVWSLMSLQQQRGIETDNLFGYAIILDNYISLVVHATDPDINGLEPDFNFQTSISAFELRDDGMMYCASLIGHSNFGGDFEPELRGFPRVYRVEASELDLTLMRSDGSLLQFRRMQPGFFPPGALGLLNDLRNEGFTPLDDR